jgi:hypothetical protein
LERKTLSEKEWWEKNFGHIRIPDDSELDKTLVPISVGPVPAHQKQFYHRMFLINFMHYRIWQYNNCMGYIGDCKFMYDKMKPYGEINNYNWWGNSPSWYIVGVYPQFSITFIDEFGQDICTTRNDNLYKNIRNDCCLHTKAYTLPN